MFSLLLLSVFTVHAFDCPAAVGSQYGATCITSTSVDTPYDNLTGCTPSSECGYLYCCLPCGGVKNVCMLPPYIGQLLINCIPNNGTGNNWFGCPCQSASECVNGGDGWSCSIPTTANNVYFKNVNGISGTNQSLYNTNVCWTNTLSYSTYYSQFSNGVYPKAPICASPADCKTNTSLVIANGGPYYCDKNNGLCNSIASCDPVTHSCQSRQVNTGPNIGSSSTSSYVKGNWWYNGFWSSSNCYNTC